MARYLPCILVLRAAGQASVTFARGQPRAGAACRENICGGGADYPVNGTLFYSEFTVPGLPTNASAIDEGTYFIYTNIFFRSAPSAPSGLMNQFVPQLMLGNPLSGSSNWPFYLPQWSHATTWVFASQYFMEIFNSTSNATQANAAAGEVFNCLEGETLWTSFARSPAPDFAWTLTMGVKGDASRTSIVISPAPYMGLISTETMSWGEAAYDTAHLSTCMHLCAVRLSARMHVGGHLQQ